MYWKGIQISQEVVFLVTFEFFYYYLSPDQLSIFTKTINNWNKLKLFKEKYKKIFI